MGWLGAGKSRCVLIHDPIDVYPMMHTAVRWRASCSDNARDPAASLLQSVGRLEYLSMRLGNNILLCMI